MSKARSRRSTAITRDYRRQARTARELAAEALDSKRVLTRLLERLA